MIWTVSEKNENTSSKNVYYKRDSRGIHAESRDIRTKSRGNSVFMKIIKDEIMHAMHLLEVGLFLRSLAIRLLNTDLSRISFAPPKQPVLLRYKERC